MKNSFSQTDTIVAVATPAGKGALGVVRISGPSALDFCSSLLTFTNSKNFKDLPAQKVALCTFHQRSSPRRGQNGTEIDHVLVTPFRAPHSYTGEDVVEISCHGSPAILKQVLGSFLNIGARLAEPGEFSQRAFLNGKMDLAQAEAVADLIHAQTELSRAVAFSQAQGRLSGEIRRIRDNLVQMLAHIEVNIDHSDDPTVGSTMPLPEMAHQMDLATERIRRLIRSYEFGKILRDGVRIAIVGKPNVGKSSLLNRLLGSDRAIVAPTPGTTRDTIEEGFDLLGLPAVLVDTAGLRPLRSTRDPVEKIGMERTQKAFSTADVVITMLDSSQPFSPEDSEIMTQAANKEKGVLVFNKNDLPSQLDIRDANGKIPKFPTVSISALNNTGMDELLKTLYESATGSMEPSAESFALKHTTRFARVLLRCESASATTPAEETIVSSLRQRNCLCECEQSLIRARSLCAENPMDECLAVEIRGALDSLGEITGEIMNEDILQEIFSRFCVGK